MLEKGCFKFDDPEPVVDTSLSNFIFNQACGDMVTNVSYDGFPLCRPILVSF